MICVFLCSTSNAFFLNKCELELDFYIYEEKLVVFALAKLAVMTLHVYGFQGVAMQSL